MAQRLFKVNTFGIAQMHSVTGVQPLLLASKCPITYSKKVVILMACVSLHNYSKKLWTDFDEIFHTNNIDNVTKNR